MLQLTERHRFLTEIFIDTTSSVLKRVTLFPTNGHDDLVWVQCREAALDVIDRIAHKSIPEIAKPEVFESQRLAMIATGKILDAFMDSNITYSHTLLEVINERQLSTEHMLLVQKIIKQTMSELRGLSSGINAHYAYDDGKDIKK